MLESVDMETIGLKMSIEEYRKKNIILQEKVIAEIEAVKKGKSEKNLLQLQGILEELKNSSEKKYISLYYPRVIVDSWDYSDQLGIELMELAALYEKYKGESFS